jgi:3-keto-5-aminohexanoate cleavage enzyme
MTETLEQFADRRVMILCAPNGARRTSNDHPDLPVTPEQLANEAIALVAQQVSVLHLHVRDKQQGHSLDPVFYRAAMKAIRKAVGEKLIIQVTSESVGIYKRDEQMEMVRALRPEAVSLALSELCPDESAERDAGKFYEFLRKEEIWPQHILYTADEVARFEKLRMKGFFANDEPSCLLVLGNYVGAVEGSVEELQEMRTSADFSRFPWSVCCFGGSELTCMLSATERGGHVRMGFENNLLLENGDLADSNASLIAQYLDAVSESDRKPATSDEVREQFLNFC